MKTSKSSKEKNSFRGYGSPLRGWCLNAKCCGLLAGDVVASHTVSAGFAAVLPTLQATLPVAAANEPMKMKTTHFQGSSKSLDLHEVLHVPCTISSLQKSSRMIPCRRWRPHSGFHGFLVFPAGILRLCTRMEQTLVPFEAQCVPQKTQFKQTVYQTLQCPFGRSSNGLDSEW